MTSNSDRFRGFVGQGMKPPLTVMPDVTDFQIVTATGAGIYTAPRKGVLAIYAWGAGGAGFTGGSSDADAGGSAAALKKRLRITKGQQLLYSVGAGVASADGQDTIVNLPSGAVLRAGGGKVASAGTGGKGGIASGGDINLNGSDGVVLTSVNNGTGNPGGGANPGAAGLGSWNPGAGFMSQGGSGAPGFSELGSITKGGDAGNSGSAPNQPGASGGAQAAPGSAATTGANGKLVFVLVKNP